MIICNTQIDESISCKLPLFNLNHLKRKSCVAFRIFIKIKATEWLLVTSPEWGGFFLLNRQLHSKPKCSFWRLPKIQFGFRAGTITTCLGAFPDHIGLEAFVNASEWYAMWSTGLATITSYEIRNYADFWEHIYSLLSKVLVIHFSAGVATTVLITKIAVTQQQQHLCNKE